MRVRGSGGVVGLALLGLTSMAAAGGTSLALDGVHHKSASIHGTVSGVSGALPFEPVTTPATSTDCKAPACAAFTIALTLPHKRTSGVLTAKAGTVGANLGLTMRLVNSVGALVASSSNSGVGVTTSGPQQGEILRSNHLAPGNYKLYVLSVGGTADFKGVVQWS
jgi:hypothetical protein